MIAIDPVIILITVMEFCNQESKDAVWMGIIYILSHLILSIHAI